jgi:CRP/FNR family cyclic AMP-dependent transcriptional regulator
MMTVGVLAGEPFFEGMPRTVLRRMATAARPITFPAGHRLFTEGGVADRFWVLQDGIVALDLRVPGRGPVMIETLEPGAVLGWSWAHAPYRWRFGAVAQDPVRAIEFDARLVRALGAVDPAMGYELSQRFTKVIIDRLQATRIRMLDPDLRPAEHH